MPENRARHFATKLKVTLVLATVLSLLHWTAWGGVTSIAGQNTPVTFLTIAGFDIQLRPLLISGGAFGVQLLSEVYNRAIFASLAALGLAVWLSALVLIPPKYGVQLVAVELLCASGIAQSLEILVTGSARAYVDLGFGTLRLPTFNLYDLVIYSALAFVYLLVFLRFFRLLPSFRRAHLKEGVAGQLRDPLLENRKPLRLMLSVLIAVSAVVVISNGLSAFTQSKGSTDAATMLGTVASTVLLSGAINLGPLMLFWRVIPTRAVDLIYLRSFRLDRRGWKTVRRLRQRLGRRLRISGVVDPEESRRWYYLLYWLANPFMFALGDLGRVNATRHNVFLEGNWQEGVKVAFSIGRAAVFDCRALTENLAWEIRTGLEMLRPGLMFFIIPDAVSPAGFRASLTAAGLADVAVRPVPSENYVHESHALALANRIREVWGAEEGARQ